MTTANDIVRSALFRAGVSSDINPASPAAIQEATATFYDWLAQLNLDGISLGLEHSQALPPPGDPLGVDAGLVQPLKAAFAVRICTTFSVDPSPNLVTEATKAMVTINSLYMRPQPPSYPGTMPRGQGNHRGPYGAVFYPVPEFNETYDPDGIQPPDSGA